MSGEATAIRTGSVIEEVDGSDRKIITAAIRLPDTTWQMLTAGIYDFFYGSPADESAPLADEDVPLAFRIRLFLDMLVTEWEAGGETHHNDDDELHDHVPF